MTNKLLVVFLMVGAVYCLVSSALMAQETAATSPAPVTPPDAVSGATAPAVASPAPTSSPDAVAGATAGRRSPNFLGLTVPMDSHRIAGYTAGGLLAAAGVIGAIRYLDLRARGHQYREENELDDECVGIIQHVWKGNQWLRWTHVGLVAAGESLYLYDAITGISLIPADGQVSAAGKLHGLTFIVHAALMASEIAVGCLMSDALSRGDHQQLNAYGLVHTGIGLAIPALIIGSGLAVDNGLGLP